MAILHERTRSRLCLLHVLLILHVAGGLLSGTATAETWVCSQPGQMDRYSDHAGPGCRQLGESKTYSTLSSSPKPTGSPTADGSRSMASTASLPAGTADLKSRSAFSDRSLLLPIVAVSRPQPGLISGSWLGLVASLTVGYAADGRGPEIETDGNLAAVSLNSLRTATIVAASAVGYDPKYVKVRLLIPTVVDGPSAGSMYAVGIASALLGDPIRRDVCMSGTIEPNFEIKPVGRLADKMNACKMLSKTTMIVPDGLDNSHLSFQGTERSVHVIEVHTLNDAYAAATGQSLRPASPF